MEAGEESTFSNSDECLSGNDFHESISESSDHIESDINSPLSKKKGPFRRISDYISNIDIWLGLRDDNWHVHILKSLPHDESFISENGFNLERSTWVGLTGKWSGFFDNMNPPVFIPASTLLLLFIIVFSIKPDWGVKIFIPAREAISTTFGWFYVLVSNFLIILLVYCALGRIGDIKLGDDDATPDFSTVSWSTMLFGAGLGIGLVFYGMYEPMYHFTYPPTGLDADVSVRLSRAVPLTMLGWAFHVWCVFSFVGLCICYFHSRLKLPCSMRSTLYPMLGKYMLRWPGHLFDVIAMFGTVFGLATALGTGALQISSGLNYVWPSIPNNFVTQVVVITCTTTLAIISLLSGIGKGMKYLSNFAMGVVIILCAVLFCCNDPDVSVQGSTQQLLDAMTENLGGYMNIFFERMFRVGFTSLDEKAWMNKWMTFYIAYAFAWSCFVSLFLAHISKNRTVREYVVFTMIIPWLIQNVTFTVLGVTGCNALIEDPSLIDHPPEELIFRVFEHYNMKGIISGSTTVFLSITSMVVLISFFVSSSDSGSFVVEGLGSGGNPNSPVWQKIFWAIIQGATGLIILYSGGDQALESLQAMCIVLGLPLSIVIIMMAACLIKTIHRDPYITSQAAPLGNGPPLYDGTVDFRAVTDIHNNTLKQTKTVSAVKLVS